MRLRPRTHHASSSSRPPRSSSTSLDSKWCLLLLFSMAVFAYMVFVTEVLQVTPTTTTTTSVSSSSMMDKNSLLVDFINHSVSSHSIVPSYNTTTNHSTIQQPSSPTVELAAPTTEEANNNDLVEKVSVDETTNTSNTDNNNSSNDNNNDTDISADGEPQDVKEWHIPRRKRNKHRRRNDNNGNHTKPEVNMTEIDWSKWTFEESAMPPNISNMEFYNITSDGEFNLWDDDPTLPYWMKSYFHWHKWKRKTWDLANWKLERWMIVQCLIDQDKRKCGGTSDRLKPIPTLLRIAYDTKRILLIRWTRPSMLEDFLMPPEGGIDWRVPPAMVDVIQNLSYGKKLTPFQMIDKYTRSGMSLVRTKYQTNTPDLAYAGLVEQDQNASLPDYTRRIQVELSSQPDFNQVFRSVWRIFFTPSTPVAEVIQSKLSTLGLTPNHYVASHLRALYAVDHKDDRPEWYIQLFTENALACATQLRPGVPIFFASDSTVATEYALKVGQEKNVTSKKTIFDNQPVAEAVAKGVVASIPDPNPPWHLDTMIGPVEKFYDTFVDLYLMAMAGCVTYGKGGYGHWALLIGGNISCNLKQDFIGAKQFVRNPCAFTTTSGREDDPGVVNSGAHGTLLLPPMTKSIDGTQLIGP